MLHLEQTVSNDSRLLELMQVHYSQPKGFVGRRICYAIMYEDIYYGHIVAGSATFNLPNRNDFLGVNKSNLRNLVNNTFYHIRKVDERYPVRNFTTRVILEWEQKVKSDWLLKYGDHVLGFETLVELPRTGDLYRKAGWSLLGQTAGYTCKRVAGDSKEKWTKDRGGGGVRVWDTVNLRPKLIFCKRASDERFKEVH